MNGLCADTIDGAEALRRFCTPAMSLRRASNHMELVERARYHLRQAQRTKITTSVGQVQTYAFQPQGRRKSRVLIVHGWSGEAAFMGAFAEYLRRRGYCPVLMDLPAHGGSEGEEASLFDCAQAIVEVAHATGPFPLALGHSIGGMALLLAGEGHYPLRGRYRFEAYSLVSMPNEFTDIAAAFAKELDLTPKEHFAFERKLEQMAGRPINDFSGTNLLGAVKRPAQLLHATDDNEVPFACSEHIARSTPRVQLQPFNNLGHRAILYAPQVVRAATSFFDEVSVCHV